MIEAKYQDLFKAELRRYGCYVPSIAASLFMSGQPDLMLYNKVGNCFPIELKVWRLQSAPVTSEQITGLLKGPQKAVIVHTLWKLNVYCPILAFDIHQDGIVWHCYKDLPILKLNWKELALDYTNRKPMQS